MSEWEIQLMPKGFNGWMDFMQRQITQAKDLLAILDTEEQKISLIWEGGAKEQWTRQFQKEILQAGECVSNMEQLVYKTKEAAVRLARLEKKMISAAKEMG